MQDDRQFPQIAYNIRPMVYALGMGGFAVTGDTSYALCSRRATGWFLVGNRHQQMHDP